MGISEKVKEEFEGNGNVVQNFTVLNV